MIVIQPFETKHQESVVKLILSIQREEFGIPITAEEQPDLNAIPTFYQTGNGEFFVAVSGAEVIGTIGLRDIGNGQAALRKMFVAASYRGSEHQVALKLLHRLLDHAAARQVSEIFLGTTEKFLAARRFYLKNGFRQIPPQDLPPAFPRMAVDNKFYLLER